MSATSMNISCLFRRSLHANVGACVRMKDERIVLSTDGPDHNVLKIKPPMCFSVADADELVQKLDMILSEIDSCVEDTASKAVSDSTASLVDQSTVPVDRCILSLA